MKTKPFVLSGPAAAGGLDCLAGRPGPDATRRISRARRIRRSRLTTACASARGCWPSRLPGAALASGPSRSWRRSKPEVWTCRSSTSTSSRTWRGSTTSPLCRPSSSMSAVGTGTNERCFRGRFPDSLWTVAWPVAVATAPRSRVKLRHRGGRRPGDARGVGDDGPLSRKRCAGQSCGPDAKAATRLNEIIPNL